jgi:hypothetical protein
MHELEPKRIKRLIDRLLLTRARRDREERLSDSWCAADAEMHEIERAIFRAPLSDAKPRASTDQHTGTADRRSGDAGRRGGGTAAGRPNVYGSRVAG